MHRDADALRDHEQALATEWLLTDGEGGYACATVLFCGTRRYHGLWVPALKPPLDRRVVLAHIEEHLGTPAREAYLSTCEYADGFHPDGSSWAQAFDLEPQPRLISRVHDVTVEREVLLLRGGRGVCVTYRVGGVGSWTLRLSPFLALRSMHALTRHHDSVRVEPLDGACGFRCLSTGMPGVFLWTDAPAPAGSGPYGSGGNKDGNRDGIRTEAAADPRWYYGVLRRVERERGLPDAEDLLSAGHWTVSGEGPAEWHVFCSFDPPREMAAAPEREAVLKRRANLLKRAGSPADQRLARLALAADAFVVRRRTNGRDLATIIAGYPWFGDWGRDAMVALPGLTMEVGRLDVAERVLEAFAAATSEGMVPNRFAEETGRPEYNTVDASLWFLQAMAAYVRAGGRAEFVREHLWPAAFQICDRYQTGTRFGIHADTDGLILAGSARTQLTWMDATSGGRPVTPRYGKAVEICALWISGLGLMRELADALGLEVPPAVAECRRARPAFVDLFWNEAAGCLYDCVLAGTGPHGPDGTKDASIRPNQILAVGLPHAPLQGERAQRVVRTVRRRLLTPRGLRTLAADDPAYRGTYAGGPDERDATYHQGTVWPWLLGPYVDALFAVESERQARREAAELLAGLLDSMEEAGLGQISEVFDGDPPHRARGCFAQAWSVAAAIHVWRRLEATGGIP